MRIQETAFNGNQLKSPLTFAFYKTNAFEIEYILW